jgi:SRSO17 transposase
LKTIATYHLICGVDPRFLCVFQENEGQLHISSYVTALGHGLIDRELYLPEEWCADLPRRRAAHIPDHLSFATKPELARRMVQRAQHAQVPIRWVVADSVYGHSSQLRQWLQTQGYSYVLAVPSTEAVCIQTRTGELLLRDVATITHQALRTRDWHRLSQSLGTKGERLFDWARLPIALAGYVDGRQWLLVRRCLDDPSELAFFLVWAPPDTPLPLLVQAIGARWHVEEDLEAHKALGLGHYEGRSYLGWYRHYVEYTLDRSVVVKGTSVIFDIMDVIRE